MSLRERKKLQVRHHISDVATELFRLRGFEAVTIAEIAVAADVAKATVTNYFPRKEDLLLDMQSEAEELLLAAIRDRPAGQGVVEAVRTLMHRLLKEQHSLSSIDPGVSWFGDLIAQSPALQSRAREQREQLEVAVAGLLATETGDAAQADLVARLLLATATAVVITPYRRMRAGEPPATVAEDQARVIDRAFDQLSEGLRSYGG